MTPHGTNTLLLGASGTGKTYAIRTFIEAGITPFILCTEPGIESTLGDLPKDKCHWHYVAPAAPDWAELFDSAKQINTLSYKTLAEKSDMNKRKYGQFLEIINLCNNFTCDRTGESFGDIATWGPDRVFVLDSLSGLNTMVMNLVVGSKPTKSMTDWMVAMDSLERFLTTLVTSLQCFFVLTAHLERETDETTGGVQLMAATLGRKLAPRLPRYFDDVIMAKRDGAIFSWSTAAHNVDLKTRNLPLAENLLPSFVPIITAWRTKTKNLEALEPKVS